MKEQKIRRETYFSFATFLPTFIIVVAINIISFSILLKDIDVRDIQISTAIVITIFWCIVAWLLTMLIRYNAITHYDRPMKKLAKAIQEVANGDFSVYVTPLHTTDNMNYLDTMMLDFNKMVEELGSVETLKTDFFSNVSHEIKTPLAIIQNYAELLNSEGLTDRQKKEYTQAIYETTKRLSALITNILKLNKLEKQSIVLQETPYDLSQQLCECILRFENLWEKKHIEMDVDVEDSRMIYVDANLMELVWNNLLSNAIKFSSEYGKIWVKEYVEDNVCYVSIKDTGCGMSKETMHHIFDKFYQGDTSHATQGNGLGLALAMRVIQLSNAQIQVVSEEQKGCEFIVKIPLRKELDVKE